MTRRNDRFDVLVVDDNDEVRLILRRGLERRGLSCVTCGRPEEAVGVAIQTRPRVIVLDIAMPGVDGFELARRFHAIEQTADVPLVFLSAIAEAELEERGWDLGAQEVWQKGEIDLDQFADRLRAAIAGTPT